MRVVLDTNVFLAGLLWFGPPYQILELADDGKITLCSSQELLEELDAVLRRAKFRPTLERRQTSADELMVSVFAAVKIFETIHLLPIRALRDPGDVIVFECAISANAEYIISGDKDLLILGTFQNIPIVAPAEFLRVTENQ